MPQPEFKVLKGSTFIICLDLKTKYEAEIIDRVAAENKVQGLEEQIALNNRMFEEIASSRVVTTTNDAEAVSILPFFFVLYNDFTVAARIFFIQGL